MLKIRWPVAVAVLFTSLLIWYVFYTQSLVRIMHENAELITSMFGVVQEGIQDPTAAGPENALFRLQGTVIRSGLPLVVTDGDSVTWVENLPFDADENTPEGQRAILEFVERLNEDHPPIAGVGGETIHFGDPIWLQRLDWIPSILAGGLLITVAIGFLVIRYQRRSEQEKAWTAMARELAHQLGTPISSLSGWLELMKIPESERPGSIAESEVTEGIEEDLVRLGRISRRFELIGMEPKLEPLAIRDVVGDLEAYLQGRLPRLAKGVLLVVDVPKNLPPVIGNEVLLTWALENVVKNALNAMAGRGGEIRIRARADTPGWVHLWIQDTGPGVPLELRDNIFEPGVSGKSGGWGVGLTLSRRIIEGAHGGRIGLLEGVDRGATFEIRVPAARL